MSEIRIGQVVRSKCGRDAGKFFVIVGREKDFVFLADGDTRRVEAPKKKNIKHVQVTGFNLSTTTFAETVKESLSNREIRSGLRKIVQGDD
jgi:large subunit ribosomal protein L14e